MCMVGTGKMFLHDLCEGVQAMLEMHAKRTQMFLGARSYSNKVLLSSGAKVPLEDQHNKQNI